MSLDILRNIIFKATDNKTHKEMIRGGFPTTAVHLRSFQINSEGMQGSPIQFFFTWY